MVTLESDYVAFYTSRPSSHVFSTVSYENTWKVWQKNKHWYYAQCWHRTYAFQVTVYTGSFVRPRLNPFDCKNSNCEIWQRKLLPTTYVWKIADINSRYLCLIYTISQQSMSSRDTTNSVTIRCIDSSFVQFQYYMSSADFSLASSWGNQTKWWLVHGCFCVIQHLRLDKLRSSKYSSSH